MLVSDLRAVGVQGGGDVLGRDPLEHRLEGGADPQELRQRHDKAGEGAGGSVSC